MEDGGDRGVARAYRNLGTMLQFLIDHGQVHPMPEWRLMLVAAAARWINTGALDGSAYFGDKPRDMMRKIIIDHYKFDVPETEEIGAPEKTELQRCYGLICTLFEAANQQGIAQNMFVHRIPGIAEALRWKHDGSALGYFDRRSESEMLEVFIRLGYAIPSKRASQVGNYDGQKLIGGTGIATG